MLLGHLLVTAVRAPATHQLPLLSSGKKKREKSHFEGGQRHTNSTRSPKGRTRGKCPISKTNSASKHSHTPQLRRAAPGAPPAGRTIPPEKEGGTPCATSTSSRSAAAAYFLCRTREATDSVIHAEGVVSRRHGPGKALGCRPSSALHTVLPRR